MHTAFLIWAALVPIAVLFKEVGFVVWLFTGWIGGAVIAILHLNGML